MKKIKLLSYFLFVLFFTNCEKELYDKAIQSNKKDFTFKTISFKEVNTLNKEIISKIMKLKSNNENVLDKTSQLYGITIDTTNIIYLQRENGYNSFSFRVVQDLTLSNFKNVVIHNYIDGSQEVLLIKFNLTKPFQFIQANESISDLTTSIDVTNLSNSNTSNRGTGGDCITVGYYTTVDACAGELVTPSENPRCFNADGTRATREIFITLAEGCSDDGGGGDDGGGFNGNPNNGNEGSNGSNGGGDYNGSGIFIPNIYTGDEDPNNAEFMFVGQVATYFNALPQNLKSLTNNNTWVYSYLVDYFRNNGNTVNFRNTPKATTALNNFYNFQLNSYNPNFPNISNERLNFWAYYNFLNNNTANVNTQAIFDIRDFVINTDFDTAYSIINYLFDNYENPEVLDFIYQMINEITNNAQTQPLLENNIILIESNLSNQITDIDKYLECFQLNQGAVFTLYIDQPTANSNTSWSGTPFDPNVGHTFISIKQGSIRRVLGFYPSTPVDLSNTSTAGVFENNSAHDFDVSISFNISQSQLSSLVAYIKVKSTVSYDLNSFNCTDFGMGASSTVGLPLLSAYGKWGAPGIGSGGGDNPGQLGQNIRNIPTPAGATKNTTGGNSPSNIGICN